MKFKILAAVSVMIISTSAAAQDRQVEIRVGQSTEKAQPEASQYQSVPVSERRIVKMMPENTIVQLSPLQEITSKRIDVGDKVAFAVVSDVVEGGSVVIPRGSTVQGSISWKTGRAIGGKSGKFEVTFDNVAVRGKRYAMRGQHRQEGRGNTVGALLGSIIISGRSAVMLPGDLVNAFTAVPIPYEI
ncbi:hypothetical protein GRI44_02360 [Altererythrobacter confluentis]|uniref:Uncharacterized protein n=1 Tax=Allopontixanthobacter confluentis TaxID=1849021 RepID=A0A6L7GCG4_9SPHN|nr:hypothetical protein [Allopontixanthobacter confluentis]MXP13597.1 hypothetical protein [Allopontixanthobacter confluentis]